MIHTASTPCHDAQKSTSRFVKFFAEMRFLSLSMLLHTIVLFVCGGVVIYRVQEEPPDFQSAPGVGLFDDVPAPQQTPATEPEEQPKEIVAAITPSSAPSSPTIGCISITGPGNFTVKSAGFSGLSPAAIGSYGNGLGMNTEGLGVGRMSMRLFDKVATGQRIVIVLDVSGSMVHGTGKSGKTYGELEQEVIRVVRELDMKSSFGLVVFSRGAKLYRPTLARSLNDEKERAIRWLTKQTPTTLDNPKADEDDKAFHHGTRADLGLEEALKLSPDLVFFISDGEPSGTKPADVLTAVEVAQKSLRKPAAIHAIAYLADGGQKFMRDLAEKNYGTFREVNPQDIAP
jgi:hypothetical protein